MSTENTPEKKSHKVRNTIIGVIALFVLIAIIQGVSGGDETEAPNTVTTTKVPAKDKSAKKPAKKKAVAKKWTTVVTLKGNADKESDTIKLGKGDKRVKYVVKGGDMSMVGIYLMKEGKNFDKDGGIPLSMVDGASTDTTRVRKSAGNYYVKVIAANADYTVTVQEKK